MVAFNSWKMKNLIILLILLPCKILLAQEKAVSLQRTDAETMLKPESPAYNPVKAFQTYQHLAEMGDVPSMNALGILYAQGTGTSQDTTLSVQWFTKAAPKYSNAFINLGQLYRQGTGVKQNFKTAFGYFQKAEKLGNPDGYYQEGYARYKGLGGDQNYAEAVRLFRLGIQRGSFGSAYMLGLCFRNGYGVTANVDSARYYINNAAVGKYPFALEEMQVTTPENPDFAKSGSSSTTSNKSAYSYKAVKHHLAKDSIAGQYEGYIIRYDWSGQHVIGKSPLQLTLDRRDSTITGIWREEDHTVTINAKLTDTSLVFNNTAYARSDHYHTTAPANYEFRNAHLQIAKAADTVLLSGNLQLWSLTQNEPEKPIYITLSRIKAFASYDEKDAKTNDADRDSLVTGFVAYPNPFSNNFSVKFTTRKKVSGTLTLTEELSGKLIYRKELPAMAVGEHTQGITANVNPGLYVLRLVCGNKVNSALVIKQ